jgi:SAM-dependent methyltransferase
MRTDVGGSEDVPVRLFFRPPEAMGVVESAALRLARGRVLDFGAGPGAHAAPLARSGLAVTAAELLPEARAALRERGVADVREGGLDALEPGERFDTVLVLMNGLGLPGSLAALGPFLSGLAAVLAEGGQILADSTDPGGWGDPEDGRYPGQVHMQLGFEGRWGTPFPFLFVDADTLRDAAAAHGLDVAVVAEEEDGRYLARITPTSGRRADVRA